ncbi:Six-hairpin glycosidase-like protein [Cubamyces lactineus]|nr:Six-hairpin glycosidase-like protein [Cubamyces lactineus]
MLMRRAGEAAAIAATVSSVLAVPPAFPSSGKGIWYTQPGRFEAWSNDWIPIGNGYLAATLLGETAQEVTQLNIESLWSGGPFQDPSYNGGNKLPSDQATMAQDMQVIRQAIFESPNGTIDNIEQLTTDAGAYGSYVGAGYLLSSFNASGPISDYFRWLDIESALHGTQWTQGNTTFFRETLCSNPTQACLQRINTTDASTLPTVTYAYSVAAESGIPVPTISCFDNSTLQIAGTASDPGMAFEILARVAAQPITASVSCASSGSGNATLTVSGASDAVITWVGGTNYDMNAGDAAHNFTFQGADPHDGLVTLLSSVGSYDDVRAAHVADYVDALGDFDFQLAQIPNLETPTDQLKAQYQTDVGNVYLEWVLFHYARYLLVSSSRGALPANLQGKWAKDASNPWSADYHSNINIQMNYWFAETTGLDVVTPLFDYIEKTWAPRGAQTAQYLYNIEQGWVTHNEMNIFGHTGMKGGGNTAQWSDYPESNAWMMIHVWDHFDFTRDVDWFKAQGYPLLKSAAQFHLKKLIPDERFNDSTLVVNPCNSPEQAPITMGCAHAQQLIWQLFNAIEKGFDAAGDTDTDFLGEVISKRDQMDKGIHVGSWGQLQEWKVDMDSPTDTHRHLSHLIGLYPGYAIASYNQTLQATSQNLTRAEVWAAAETSLIHRGNGTGPDADAGWEKVWRAACWAQLHNASQFYHELSYAIERNFAPNLFSLYPPLGEDAIFQIDANFGYAAALLNGLIQTPDIPAHDVPYTVYLLPAVPKNWPIGALSNVRLRGGPTFSFSWEPAGLTSLVVNASANAAHTRVRILHGADERDLGTFDVRPGTSLRII